MQRFTDRTVAVTGGGGGIGGATCRRFGKEGARVAVLDLDLAAAEKVAADIRADGGVAQAIGCDITDRASVDAAIAAIEAKLGPLDVLVNNAGWDVFKPFVKTEPAQWDRLIAVNLVGALHMHHAVLPGMASRGRGRIVNIASDAARVGSSGEAVYAARKGGLVSFQDAGAQHARSITINVVCPDPPTPRSWPPSPTRRPTRRSCATPSRARSRSAASASPTTSPAPSSSSPATTRAS
jgi:2-hydroxycyclohexanecarboxyl-CoA dehydrogenase